MSKKNDYVDELSKQLAFNHVLLSSINLGTQKKWNSILPNYKKEDYKERRIIAVVGAGSSASVGLPLANEASKILKGKLKIKEEELESELNRLGNVYRLNKNDFETTLMAMGTSTTRTKELRKHLHKIFSAKNPPILTYEVLAHLLKHRFLDAIINFNYDELLDQSIDDEIGYDNYHYILSDGDCLNIKKNEKYRYDLPLYIKPHGTAGHKSTLRFTRDDYYGLPEDIRNLLLELFSDLPMTLILFGFGMQSFEFNLILKESKKLSDIFSFNTNNLSKPAGQLADIGENVNFFHININKRYSLEKAIEELWLKVSNNFSQYFKPRHIMRHKLLCCLFNDVQNYKNAHLKILYLKYRTVIELAFSIAKCKGLIDLSVLSTDRCGKYYELHKLLEPTCKSLYEICKEIGLKEVGYSREVLRLLPPNEDDDTGLYAIISEEDFKNKISKIMDYIEKTVDVQVKDNMLNYGKLFRETMLALYRGEEVEITNKPDLIYSKIFSPSKILNTYSSLRFYTLELLSELEKSDCLLIVAETGEWLLNAKIIKKISDKNINMYLLVADFTRSDQLKDKYGSKIRKIKQMPWWTHNKHMTLIYRRNKAYHSIYFGRRLRKMIISPVYLDEHDSSAILESFIAYWKKSNWYKERPNFRRNDLNNPNFLFE